MKKLVLFIVATLFFATAKADAVVGLFCNNPQIQSGESATIRFVIESGNSAIDYFIIKNENTGEFTHYNKVYVTNSQEIVVYPQQTTTYTLHYARAVQGNCTINSSHKTITIYIGGGVGNVQTIFTLPESCYENEAPIHLTSCFWSNVPNYASIVKFEGLGVSGNYFYPNNSGGPGTKTIKAHFEYNGMEYGISRDIKVIRPGTGIDEEYDNRISISPNPTQGLLNISESCEMVEIYSMTGLLLKTFDNITTIDISDFSNGVYIVRLFIEDQDQPINKKIVKN